MMAYQPADEITLVHSGADYFDRLIQLLDEARETIHLQTYIFDNDETGQLVVQALKRAATRGVCVRVLLDRFGSNQLPPSFVQDLLSAGIEFRFFEHIIVFWKWRFGRTLHHKVTVVDAYSALIGGINIADKYRGAAETPAYLDFAVLIRGAVCAHLFQMCNSIFLQQYWKRKYPVIPVQKVNPETHPAGLVRFRQNDWMRGRSEIYQSYRQAIIGARHSLILVASYFLPSYALQQRLAKAARRGVEIKILLTGLVDVYLSGLAEQHLTAWMVGKGIRVFHWNQSVMHGKAILSDRRLAGIGSYNINRLSRIRSMELNVDILDPDFTRSFGEHLDELLHHQCTEITAETLKPRSRWQKWKAQLAYYLVYFLMRLLFPQKRR
jgi:cardiolipin synthase